MARSALSQFVNDRPRRAIRSRKRSAVIACNKAFLKVARFSVASSEISPKRCAAATFLVIRSAEFARLQSQVKKDLLIS
jgi:hypothetical protein